MNVVFSRTAAKNYHRLPPYLREAVMNRLEKLAADAGRRDLDVKPVKGYFENSFRLRVGPVRVVYFIGGETVNVFAVGFRGGVYK